MKNRGHVQVGARRITEHVHVSPKICIKAANDMTRAIQHLQLQNVYPTIQRTLSMIGPVPGDFSVRSWRSNLLYIVVTCTSGHCQAYLAVK